MGRHSAEPLWAEYGTPVWAHQAIDELLSRNRLIAMDLVDLTGVKPRYPDDKHGSGFYSEQKPFAIGASVSWLYLQTRKLVIKESQSWLLPWRPTPASLTSTFRVSG